MGSLPYWIQEDISYLNSNEDITGINITTKECDTSGNMHIYLDFFITYFPHYSHNFEPRLKNPEQIRLCYFVSASKEAPQVLAIREGFPADLPHLNIRHSPSDPISICLWRNGTSALYLQHGLHYMIIVLQNWLANARDGMLLQNGWEPYPVDGLFPIHANLGELQRLSISKPGNILQGQVKILEALPPFRGGVITTLPQKQATLQIFNKKRQQRSKGIPKEKNTFPCFLLCTNHRNISSTPFQFMPKTVEDLYHILPQENTQQLIDKLKNIEFFKRNIGQSLFLFAIRRPQKLLKEIPGIADGEAAHQEIIAFWVSCPNKQYIFEQVTLVSQASPELLLQVSGDTMFSYPANMIGCGAVGSAIAVSLARSGKKIETLFDSDVLLPHNNARHECEIRNNLYYWLKSLLLADKIENITGIRPKVDVKFTSTQSLNNNLSGHLIDTTGDNSLEHTWIMNEEYPVHKIFIAHGGKIGVLEFQNRVKDKNNADILDIEAILFLQSLTIDVVADWLNSDAILSNRLLGFGCSSATMELSWATVQHHCSALLPTIKDCLKSSSSSSLLILHALTENGLPNGYFNIDVPQFYRYEALYDECSVDWIVSYSDDVLSYIQSQKKELSPRETGGYLFGLYNIEAHKITIVHAVSAVLHATATNLTLHSSIESDTVQYVIQKTHKMLTLLGTWHTHPCSSSQPSNLDKKTFDEVMELHNAPSLMLIVGNDSPFIEIKLPCAWRS